jgi:hypothetical protein
MGEVEMVVTPNNVVVRCSLEGASVLAGWGLPALETAEVDAAFLSVVEIRTHVHGRVSIRTAIRPAPEHYITVEQFIELYAWPRASPWLLSGWILYACRPIHHQPHRNCNTAAEQTLPTCYSGPRYRHLFCLTGSLRPQYDPVSTSPNPSAYEMPAPCCIRKWYDE